MGRFGVIGKVLLLVLILMFLGGFLPDLLQVSTNGSLMERLLLTAPLIISLRVALIFVAFGLAGLVVVIF